MNEQKMFCWQCQETAGNKGCTVCGVCGKTADVAALQDELVYETKRLSQVTTALRKDGKPVDKDINHLVTVNLFITITNANFDADAIKAAIAKTKTMRGKLATKDTKSTKDMVGVLATTDEDIRSLRELITYGLKGLAAYSKHANALMQDDEDVDAFIQRALAATLDDSLSVNDLIALALETGKFGVAGMALLDKANTSAYGNPEITEVDIGVRANPGILISGHDLRDLEMLLEQTAGAGIDVYTDASVPLLSGLQEVSALRRQLRERVVEAEGGVREVQRPDPDDDELRRAACRILQGQALDDRRGGIPRMPPYRRRIRRAKVIEQAKKCPPPTGIESGKIVGGFAHEQVFALAGKVVEAVKSGAIRKFVVMAGCDGRHKSRDYYAEFAKALPKDVVILTAGCAKYKYNKLDLGDIGGIPRVLDAGQCNDSYSLALIALRLKEVFGLDDINKLPLAFNIAWYEQKAVIVLLALLYLGVKNIHLGPTLPAFLSSNVAKVLVENFGIAGIGSVDDDMKLLVG